MIRTVSPSYVRMMAATCDTPTRVNRPPNWHQRPHWAKPCRVRPLGMPCKGDHMDRESCPFHDLKAEGCFQPEQGGLGVEGKQISPADVVRRADGKRMDCSAAKSIRFGVGGLLIPEETVPNPHAPSTVCRAASSRPWTSTSRKTRVFSTPEYISLPPKPCQKPTVEKFFHTGKAAGVLDGKFEHCPDPYFQQKQHEARLAFRLRTGVPRGGADPRLTFISEEDAPQKRARSAGTKRPIPRQPFLSDRPLQGTFCRFPSYISAPFEEASLKSNRRPLFTYAAKTKRSMPVGVPWCTGIASTEPGLSSLPEEKHIAAAPPRGVSYCAASRGLPPRPATARPATASA